MSKFDPTAFYSYFITEISQIRSKIEGFKSSLPLDSQEKEDILVLINKLSTKVKDNIKNLTSHDKQTYLREIESLYNLLNDQPSLGSEENGGNVQTSVPKRKFKFSGRLKRNTEATVVATDKAQEPTDKVQKKDIERLEDFFVISSENFQSLKVDDEHSHILKDPTPSTNFNIIIENISNQLLSVYKTWPPEEHYGRDSTHIHTYSTGKVRHLKKSILYLNSEIKGPLYIENLDQCVIIINQCQQLRIHDSKDTTVIIMNHVKNGDSRESVFGLESRRAIIEQCHSMLFATVDIDEKNNVIIQNNSDFKPEWAVDDFNWLERNRPSSNWRFAISTESLEDNANEVAILSSLVEKIISSAKVPSQISVDSLFCDLRLHY